MQKLHVVFLNIRYVAFKFLGRRHFEFYDVLQLSLFGYSVEVLSLANHFYAKRDHCLQIITDQNISFGFSRFTKIS